MEERQASGRGHIQLRPVPPWKIMHGGLALEGQKEMALGRRRGRSSRSLYLSHSLFSPVNRRKA
jgi:hypothetical protein